MFQNEYIIEYNINNYGIGVITYDISYINPLWKIIIFKFNYLTYYNNSMLLESYFTLEDVNKNDNFSMYSKNDKIILWKIIFSIKNYYFNKHKPDIVEHFIDGNFSKRLKLYKCYLNPTHYYYQDEQHLNIFYLKL